MNPYYQDDAVTIYHGDCREIVPTLGRFDLLLTDPPYGIGSLMKGGLNTGHWNQLAGGNPWDNATPDLTFLQNIAPLWTVWGGNYFDLPPSRCWLVWNKTNSIPTQADVELAWTNFDMPARIYDAPTGGSFKREHPTQKPIELIAWNLSLCPHASTVLDPFAGSGTTGRAAKDLGRKCTLIEKEERYCEIAAKRMGQEVLAL